MKKHNSGGNRPNARRKPTQEHIRNNNKSRENEERMGTYDRVCDTWNVVAGMHNANNDALASILPVSKIIGDPLVLAKMTPEVKTELALASKNLLNDVQSLKAEQVRLTTELIAMRPISVASPEDPDREMENMQLLAQGSQYQDWLMRYQMSVLPGIATCLDLVNSCLPEEERVPEINNLKLLGENNDVAE